MSDIKEFVEEIIADGILTREEHEEFMKLVHLDGRIDTEESAQISRIFSLLREGKLRVEDDERSKGDRTELEEAKRQAIEEDVEEDDEADDEPSEAELEQRKRRRDAIAAVVASVQKEEADRHNSIAQFLAEGRRERTADEEPPVSPRTSRINSLLLKAKERYAEKE